MKTIHVSLSSNSYDIHVEPGLLQKIDSFLDVSKSYVLITDDFIPKKYQDSITSKLLNYLVIEVPVGEASKSMEMASYVVDTMIEEGVTRDSIILALGGGVIGDLAGFVASVYMRGIDYIQIPTTLLSQIDSSVGGKVAVNSTQMKNAIGSFYQPKMVLVDTTTLKTLSPRQFNSGMAEMIKYGVIKSSSLFNSLLKEPINDSNLLSYIVQCIDIKREIVEKDVFDTGIRQVLNYGHTIGHAIEQASQYEILHGEAIAIGMLLMAKDYNYYKQLEEVLHKYNLPTSFEYDKTQLLSYIKTDKKAQKNTLNIVLVEEVGNGFVKTIKIDEITTYM